MTEQKGIEYVKAYLNERKLDLQPTLDKYFDPERSMTKHDIFLLGKRDMLDEIMAIIEKNDVS